MARFEEETRPTASIGSATRSATGTGTEPRWLSDDEQAAWRTYLMATKRLLGRLEHDLKAHGLTGDDYGVLVALSEAPEGRLRMAELADQVQESRSRLSHHVSRLEAADLVTRETCPEDRRGSWAVLTPTGRQAIEAHAPHHVALVREHFVDRLDPADLATLTRIFAHLDDPGTATP